MRVLVLGATGRIGSHVLPILLSRGHEVSALTRRPEDLTPARGLIVRAGDVNDRSALRAAVAGTDAVIAAMGPRNNRAEDALLLESAMRGLVEVMGASGVGRLIALSGAGISVPGDHKPAIDRLASVVVRRLARYVVEAKQREYNVFSQASLDWTALRPPLVGDGEPRGYRLSETLIPGARVTRADVAVALADQLNDTRFLQGAPFVLPPDRGSQATRAE